MDPLTIALFSVGVGMAGSFLKGQADKKAAEANAQTLEQNAFIMDLAAGDALSRGAFTEGRVKMQGTALASRQRSVLGSSGVDVQSGSAVTAQESTATLSALDALTARTNAAREAWGFKAQATNLRRQAAVTRATGDSQASAAILGGAVGGARYLAPFLRVSGQSDPVSDASAYDVPGMLGET